MLMMLGSQMPMEDDEPIRAGEGWDLLAGAVRDAAPPRSDREPGTETRGPPRFLRAWPDVGALCVSEARVCLQSPNGRHIAPPAAAG
ncbi:hypothetical protein KUCAC02_004974 [Chaenocephalus aceratus]|uniref:Uncharacterized protein n=1 Tax=Chaenocephalus aceratus TaxID=36190 RepID=A0ACB9X077_CHAAC|nr:hypothetical protein KUCAC02_004974 [Chaenocephalus aceratus]